MSLLKLFMKDARQFEDFSRGGNSLMMWLGMVGAGIVLGLVVLDTQLTIRENYIDLPGK